MTEHQPLDISPEPVRLRIEDYLRLDEAGAFADYGKTELIEGLIYAMSPQHRPHARMKSQLFLLLAAALKAQGSAIEAMVEVSISVPPHNVPEPDIVLTDAPNGAGLVPLESVKLIVEVADATLRHDLNRKSVIYAQHGIAEYWVVDVNGRKIEQMWQTVGKRYAGRRSVPLGESIESVTIDGLRVQTDSL